MASELLRKCATEVRKFVFDYTTWEEIVAGGSVSSATVTVSPSGPTIGTPSVTTPKVYVQVSGGTAGTTYTLECHATLSDATVVCMKGRLAVD